MNESEDERRKRVEKQNREEARQFVKEIADAYNFHFSGEENLTDTELS